MHQHRRKPSPPSPPGQVGVTAFNTGGDFGEGAYMPPPPPPIPHRCRGFPWGTSESLPVYFPPQLGSDNR